jgi:hypothetical protein
MRIIAVIVVLAVALPTALFVHERRLPVYARAGDCTDRYGNYVIADNRAACLTVSKSDVSNGDSTDCAPGTGYLCFASTHTWTPGPRYLVTHRKPSWEDPIALFLVIGGIVTALVLVFTQTRRPAVFLPPVKRSRLLEGRYDPDGVPPKADA